MNEIRKYLERYSMQSDHDWQLFSSRLKRHAYPKKTLLLKNGKTENHLSFIEKGIVRFYLDNENNELTFSFAFSNSFVSAYDSFLSQSPSSYNVECLTECILWQLGYQDLQFIYKETEIGNLIGRHASEELFLKKSKRELSLLNDSAEQRYLNLFTEQPHLIRDIPLNTSRPILESLHRRLAGSAGEFLNPGSLFK